MEPTDENVKQELRSVSPENEPTGNPMPTLKKKSLGKYIVADPEICHGKPTFVGTRIMVSQVLKRVAKGISWEDISAAWDGDVSMEAIAEAVALAERIFEAHAHEYSEASAT
jgi:uncharacterized protein (DUF433 family)